MATKPEESMAPFTPLQKFISTVSSIDKKRRQWMESSDDDVIAEYDRLKNEGSIQCNDDGTKEMKIDRILSITEFPDAGIEFRPVKITKKDMKSMEDDWEFSNRVNKEVARMICLDPSTNETSITNRVEGSEGQVKPPRGACDKEFPGSIELGSVHTHPPYYDKPLESLGDVLAFGAGEEVFSCTITKWGVGCLQRNKEPARVFNIPKTNKKTKQPIYDENGLLVYDVKSDIIDWAKSVDRSRRSFMNSTFIASMGEANDKIIAELATVPWFKPMGISLPSISTVSAPFQFGIEKSARHDVGTLYCESFVDIIGGKSAKLRTVCNDFVKKGKKGMEREPGFYVESEIKPAVLPFYAPGFPTNVYIDERIDGDVQKIKMKRDNSKFWNYSDEKRPGYHETDAEQMSRLISAKPKVETISAGAILIHRGKNSAGRSIANKECEYLLLPLPEGDKKILGKPAGLYCHEKTGIATDETCILTPTK